MKSFSYSVEGGRYTQSTKLREKNILERAQCRVRSRTRVRLRPRWLWARVRSRVIVSTMVSVPREWEWELERVQGSKVAESARETIEVPEAQKI